MNVDAWSSSTLSVVEGCMGSIPVHFAWSRDLYRSAAVTFTVYAIRSAQIFLRCGRLRVGWLERAPEETSGTNSVSPRWEMWVTRHVHRTY